MFSNNLIFLQKERAITNYRLAKSIGVHPTTIQNWRNGKHPQTGHAKQVADFFGVTMDEMLSEKRNT